MIRPMQESDIDTLVTIEQECFLTPWVRADFVGELTNERARFYVLEQDGVVVGYYGMWLVIDEFDVANVAVRASDRGKGYGNLLVEHMLSVARDEGINAITLEVRKSNTVAISLYEKFGFEQRPCDWDGAGMFKMIRK